MKVDAEQHVWTAIWGGSCVIRFKPDGTEDRRISFPAKKVSSLAFGGNDYGDIYVTTAGGRDKPNEGEGAGALFRINVGFEVFRSSSPDWHIASVRLCEMALASSPTR
jgi:D-xylonolactonase